MPQNIGDLQYRVILQSKVESRDAVGGPVETWQTVDTVWAAVTDITGREQFMAGVEGYHQTRIVRIRYRADIDESWHIVLQDGHIGRISTVNLVGRKEALDILCEIVNQ